MLTDFRVSVKTKRPGCCDWFCCGNKFGRIEKRGHYRKDNLRMKKTRRYAKHVEKFLWKKEVKEEME